MTKIVRTQPAKAGQQITVTDAQNRSFQAEAVGDIIDNKGVAFQVDGQWKVAGNSNQTQQSRNQLDRHTPKKKSVATDYIKVLAYEETETEFKFYIEGDRNPQLIYSIPSTNAVKWGNITSKSQNKNDWIVGILYFDYSLPIIVAPEYRVGALSYLDSTNPPGLWQYGGYVLAIIDPSGINLITENEVGSALEFVSPSGNGYYGAVEISNLFDLDGLNTFPSPIKYSVLIDSHTADSWSEWNTQDSTYDGQTSSGLMYKSLFAQRNSLANGGQITVIGVGTENWKNRVYYSADFDNTSKYELLSDIGAKFNSDSITNIEDINDPLVDFIGFFDALPSFNHWLGTTFLTTDTYDIRLVAYTAKQYGFSEIDESGRGFLYYVASNDIRVKGFLHRQTIIDNNQPSVWYPDAHFACWAAHNQPSTDTQFNRCTYIAGDTLYDCINPPNNRRGIYYLNGREKRIYSTIDAALDFLTYDTKPYGQNINVYQMLVEGKVNLPIINGNNNSFSLNSIDLTYNEFRLIGETKLLEPYDVNQFYYYQWYFLNTREEFDNYVRITQTGDRLTYVLRVNNQGQNTVILNGIECDYRYDYLSYTERDNPSTQGKRVYYSIPTLFYQDNNKAVVRFTEYKNINDTITFTATGYKYWNGTGLVPVAVPDESQYYIELKKGKFQGILKEDLDNQKTSINLYRWSVGESLGNGKKTKIKVKKYDPNLIVLSASYGD